ncbi:MAG: OmpA family protein [Cyclobacteriaceae bacterium]|nr:MAG: OmpA family protein [Cyclobacteriaceae bacterium]
MPFTRYGQIVASVVLFTLLGNPVHAQLDSVKLAEEYFNQGSQIFDFDHRKQAAELFVLSTQMNPKNAKAQLMAGRSIMLTIQKEKSLEYFKRAWKLDHNVDPDILYYLGQGYHYSEKFDSAILFYDRYNRILARSLNFDKSVRINEVNRKIFECRNAVIYKEHPVQVTIADLDDHINSEYPDYAPAISENEQLMVFTTRRPGENMNARVAVDHEYYEEIFYSDKVNGVWQAAKNAGVPINTNYHNASVNISPDGKELIVYHDTNGGDLLVSNRKADGTWSPPRALEGVNTEFLESSATLTSDGRTLYFTSNRPGGYGGTDIYVCTLDKSGNRWENIRNLGPLVNTELDEEGVFISASGQHLYFSSNGLAGMGDLDVYRTTLDAAKQEWTEPVNLGYPINSVENDIYFVLTADERYAYMSSLRQENLGEQDIYKIDMQNWKPVYLDQPEYSEIFAESSSIRRDAEIISPKATRSNVIVSYQVVDDENNNPMDADIEFVSQFGKKVKPVQKGTGLYEVTLNHSSDSSVYYKINVFGTGYLAYTSSMYFHGAAPGPEKISETIRLRHIAGNLNVGYILNVYFSHDGVQPLSLEGIQGLLRMMKSSPTMRVEIGGHTDNSGSDEYNMDLSKRRANAVRAMLVKGGADPDRITAVGYGKTKPLAPNDSRQGRSLNRRTEFIILQP